MTFISSKEDKLNFKDGVGLALEAGIASIPGVGGALQTLYFGAKNEERFKRIERFYSELSAELEYLKSSIPPLDNLPNKDEFLGLLEDINSEIEKAKSQPKIHYFKSFYKNTLLTSNYKSFTNQSFFLEALINLTNLEIHLLALYYQEPSHRYGIPNPIPGISDELMIGSLNRLSDYGLLTKQISSISMGGPVRLKDTIFKVSDLGIDFSRFILN